MKSILIKLYDKRVSCRLIEVTITKPIYCSQSDELITELGFT